jgi:hypothetical protein
MLVMSTAVDRPTLYRIAAEADCDPRTVAAAIAARRGERPPPRGRAGERVAAVLERHPELLTSTQERRVG